MNVKEIVIKTIPHDQHRYPTTGDWWIKENNDGTHTIEIRSSECGDWRASMAVAIHEATEALTCLANGIEPESLDRFDTDYEILRADLDTPLSTASRKVHAARDRLFAEFGGYDEITDSSEPGEDTHAPYRHEHALATQVEWILTEGMNLPWKVYCWLLEKLDDGTPTPAPTAAELVERS
jgi:hypothetical protein